jgi:hypothetical protein
MEQQVRQLIEFPFLGRKGRMTGSFELVISRTPYLVASCPPPSGFCKSVWLLSQSPDDASSTQGQAGIVRHPS